MEMTFESRPSCGKIRPIVGKDKEIGPVVIIGPVVGIGLFGGTGPVVSLAYLIFVKTSCIVGHHRYSFP